MDWTIIGIVAGVVLADLLLRLVVVRSALRVFEARPPLKAELGDPRDDAERISFPTTHGLTLRGSLFRHPDGASRGVVLFCPELGGNHWMAMNYCEGLWEAGFDVLAFDFRNQGESDHMPRYEPLHWVTEYEVADVRAAVRYVRQRSDLNASGVGLFGISRGGGAALAGASRCSDVVAVAADSAFSNQTMVLHFTQRWATLYVPAWILKVVPAWHVKLTLWMVCLASQFRRNCRYTNFDHCLSRLYPTPVFLIAGERDNYVHPCIVQEMRRRIGTSCRDVWVVPTAKHNGARNVDPTEYDRRLIEFFSDQLRPYRAVESTQAQRV